MNDRAQVPTARPACRALARERPARLFSLAREQVHGQHVEMIIIVAARSRMQPASTPIGMYAYRCRWPTTTTAYRGKKGNAQRGTEIAIRPSR